MTALEIFQHGTSGSGEKLRECITNGPQFPLSLIADGYCSGLVAPTAMTSRRGVSPGAATTTTNSTAIWDRVRALKASK